MILRISWREGQAIAALLSSRNVEQAAETAGIGVTTLLRWMRNPEFKKEYLQARRVGLAQATARLQQSSGPAAATLLKLMVDPGMPPFQRRDPANASGKKTVFAGLAQRL